MKQFTISIISKYKKHLSPILYYIFGNACRFQPSCSEYAMDAIDKHGIKKGVILSFKRFLRCNPLTKPGFDPVT